jgi:hypothetical protein
MGRVHDTLRGQDMKLSEALFIMLGTEPASKVQVYEARRLMTGHHKQLIKREQGHKDSELTEVQVYQEYHHQNVADVGVAFNGDRVWMCIDGAALFRAKAAGVEMFTEYYGRVKEEDDGIRTDEAG